MLINGGRTRDVSILGFGNTDLEDSARAEALLQGRDAHPDPNPQLGMYFRSDSYSFAHRGVPVLYTQAGIDSAARGPVWGKAQIDEYFAHRYHQPGDQYSADWDVGGAVTDLTSTSGRHAHREQQALSPLVPKQRISRAAPRESIGRRVALLAYRCSISACLPESNRRSGKAARGIVGVRAQLFIGCLFWARLERQCSRRFCLLQLAHREAEAWNRLGSCYRSPSSPPLRKIARCLVNVLIVISPLGECSQIATVKNGRRNKSVTQFKSIST